MTKQVHPPILDLYTQILGRRSKFRGEVRLGINQTDFVWERLFIMDPTNLFFFFAFFVVSFKETPGFIPTP